MLQLPLLFYMVGYPGSGKTTFATTFCQRNKIVHLHADRIGFELFRTPTFAPDERTVIMREMNRRAFSALQGGKSVIFDAGINTSEQREQLRRIAHKANTEAVGIWVKTPPTIAFERLAQPRLIMDVKIVFAAQTKEGKTAFKKAIDRFEKPQDEPYIVSISGKDSYDAQRDAVLSFIFPKR
jgi:predicted kinase